jgi:DNA-binding transcriptional ArsR family regulator
MMPNVERALDALGDPTRRRVFRRLRDGTRSVREIADGMHVTRPAVSQHLKVLKAAGLVVVRADGTRRLYAVDTRGIEAFAAGSTGSGMRRSPRSRRRPRKQPRKGNHDDRADEVRRH